MATNCTSHRGQLAGWRCTACGALLCPSCTVVLRVGSSDSEACGRCRGLAERLRVRRAEVRPFTARIGGAFGYPITPGGILSLLALGVVVRLLQIFGLPGAFLASGVYWAFLFGVIVGTWKGQDALEPPDFSDVFEDLFFPAIRGLVASAIVIVPFVVRAVTVAMAFLAEQGQPAPSQGADEAVAAAGGVVAAVLTDPLIWLLLLASAAYLPAALLAAAVSRSVLSMLDPRVPIQLIRILGSDYAIAAALNAALVVLGQVAATAVGALVGRIPLVGGVIGLALGAYPAVVAARILGLLIHTRGDELGMGHEADYLEPVLAGATPQGGAIELERGRSTQGEPASGPAPVARAVPVRDEPEPDGRELDLDTAATGAETDAPEPSADPLDAALAAGDVGAAFALYRDRQGARGTLTGAQLFEIARGAAQAAEYKVAAHALHAAASTQGDPAAPEALLVLARLYRGKLGRPDAARQAFEALVARHPGTPAADQARAELAKG